MEVPTKDELLEMVTTDHAPRVSIYLPTRFGPDTRQDPIRLKNLLREAEDELVETGFRRTKAKDLLAPATALVDDYNFWQRQSGGLALFLEERSNHYYRVPMDFAELSVVGPRYHLKPLLPLLAGHETFYVLAISMNDLRLLECTSFGQDEVKVPDMPRDIADALWADQPEKQLQFRSFESGAGNVAMFHGAGGQEPDVKDDLLRYFDQVDDALTAWLGNASNPLVLACVEYLAPIYRETASYPHIADEVIPGNPEQLRPETLRERAWELLHPRLQEEQDEAIDRYHSLAGTGRTATAVSEVVLSALGGRVDVAFVAANTQRWGLVDAGAHAVHEHPEPEAGDQDLLDFIAIQTLLNGGTVYVLPPDQMPETTGVAAIYRY